MTNKKTGLKLGMNSDHTVFDQIIMDPNLTKTVPRNQYFYTGMDAYIHCIESLNGSYRNAIGDAYSAQAVSLCRDVFTSGNMMSDENRSKMMDASYLGGCAIATSYVGVVHPFSSGNVVDYSQVGTESVGLTAGNLYYVNDIDSTRLSLHLTKDDALADETRVDITSAGGETHLLKRTFDLAEDDTGESYSIIIDGAGRVLPQIYERLKYITRRGETTEILNSIEGQQYIGTDRIRCTIIEM